MAGGENLTRESRLALAESIRNRGADRGGRFALQALVEAYRFEGCGCKYRVYQCPKDNHNFGLPYSCNSRICPRCAARYARKLRAALAAELSQYWSAKEKTFGPKFLTLTFQRDRFAAAVPTAPEYRRALHEARQFIVRFYHKWAGRRSRNGNWYSTKQYRGAGALLVPEVGPSGNLHFHALVYGPFIPQRLLSAAWFGVTGDSTIVDIRPVRNPKKAVAYVLKYLGKLPGLPTLDKLAEWNEALRGSRRLVTYGVFFGRIKAAPFKSRTKLICPFCLEKLEYRGEWSDPGKVLIDWLAYAKYIEGDRPAPVRSWFYGAIGSPDKRFEYQDRS